jgi:diguanylate cyclase
MDKLRKLFHSQNLDKIIDNNQNVAVALINVDHIMNINDELGKEYSDEVLKRLENLFLEQYRNHVYRFSDYEFTIIMPGFSLEQAFLHMESLRGKVYENQNFGLPTDRAVTISIGVAQSPRNAKDFKSLNGAAEAALMTAIELGGDQVSLPPNEEMLIIKSCYYSSASLQHINELAGTLNRSESFLFREALDDLLRKYKKK